MIFINSYVSCLQNDSNTSLPVLAAKSSRFRMLNVNSSSSYKYKKVSPTLLSIYFVCVCIGKTKIKNSNAQNRIEQNRKAGEPKFNKKQELHSLVTFINLAEYHPLLWGAQAPISQPQDTAFLIHSSFAVESSVLKINLYILIIICIFFYLIQKIIIIFNI